MMRKAIVIGTTALGFVLAAASFAFAQHGHEGGGEADSHDQAGNHHEERSSAQHSNRHEAKEAEHRREQRNHEQREEHRDRQAERRHEGQEHERHVAERDVWREHRARHWEGEHHTWYQRGGYHGYRIPDERFRMYFGPRHWFRVHSAPVMVVGGYPRFQYGGFWFSVVDPWPEYWSATWYETDDVYVDYVNDGYYMYNRRHPGVAVAVSVSF